MAGADFLSPPISKYFISIIISPAYFSCPLSYRVLHEAQSVEIRTNLKNIRYFCGILSKYMRALFDIIEKQKSMKKHCCERAVSILVKQSMHTIKQEV